MESKEQVGGERLQETLSSASKRTLLKSAWVAPLIAVVTLPRSGYAANISGGTGPYPSKDFDSKPKENNGHHFGQLKKNN